MRFKIFLFFLLVNSGLAVTFPFSGSAADNENQSINYCSVFTDEGRSFKRICGNSGIVTLKAHWPKNLKPKKFSWDCKSSEPLQVGREDLERNGKLKLYETKNQIGLIKFWASGSRIYYLWLERAPLEIAPCGPANWFTCKNSKAILWVAVSEENGENFKIKKIDELRKYPESGTYFALSNNKVFLVWEGNNEWESFSFPLKIYSGQLSFEEEILFEGKVSSTEEEKETFWKDQEPIEKILTEEKIPLNQDPNETLEWEKLDSNEKSETVEEATYRLEKINSKEFDSSLWLKLEKTGNAEDEENSIVEELPGGETKECFYENPGTYRPGLAIEFENNEKIACAPLPFIEVSELVDCRIKVRKMNTNDNYSEKLKIYLENGIEGRIEGDCLENYEPQWKVFGANPVPTENQNDNNSSIKRKIKILPLSGNEPGLNATMVNRDNDLEIECQEAQITAREKIFWR